MPCKMRYAKDMRSECMLQWSDNDSQSRVYICHFEIVDCAEAARPEGDVARLFFCLVFLVT